MAPPAGQIRPGRYLAAFMLIVVFLYALVFLTGDRKPTPKLGIDLQGGTRVTLSARTETGAAPTKESLNLSREAIETRVNGIGVSGAEVVLDGNNIIITVPGEQGDQAKNLGRTALLRFRPVVTAVAATPPPSTPPSTQPSGSATPSSPPTSGGPSVEAPPSSGAPSSGAPQGRVAPAAAAQPTGSQPPAPTSAAPSGSSTAPATSSAPVDSSIDPGLAEAIRQAKAVRQNPAIAPPLGPDGKPVGSADTAAQQAALASFECTGDDPLIGQDDYDKPLATCDEDGTAKYILGPGFIEGTEIEDAAAQVDQSGGGFVVTLTFKSTGSKLWADYTTNHVQEQAAFVLDSRVVSAPTINEPIIGGNTQISGGQGGFSQREASDLANVLKYGSLPLSFDSSEAETVSATLGLASLQAGLIAGAIGIALVFVYCLFYYRLLGVLTILSLILSGVIVYAVLVLLGRWIGFSLDLAGIAGFIVAIGITADSFVVFFERLKDEVREGRTFRSAVPRAWVRARRTILSADMVMFLAAAILYLLAVGQVRGFAFTLGMSTVLDLIVVFLVTHPLVAVASTSRTLSSPALSGLGKVQRQAQQRRDNAAAAAIDAAPRTAVKEV